MPLWENALESERTMKQLSLVQFLATMGQDAMNDHGFLWTVPERRCCWASAGRSPAAPSWWWGLYSSGPADCGTAWSAPGRTWAWCNCSVAHWPGTPWMSDWRSCGRLPWICWPTPSVGAARIGNHRTGYFTLKEVTVQICLESNISWGSGSEFNFRGLRSALEINITFAVSRCLTF